MSSLKALASIPTLTQLYRAGKLAASANNADLPNGNQDQNDKVSTVQYDLTKLEVDAIVNAANSTLLGGGGVDGAIHRAAGRQLVEECRTLNGCETGNAKITDAYNLPCKKVIHAVGPVYKNKTVSEPLLKGCYRNSLQLAVENDCKSIAFSAISTGIYGYPSEDAATAALREVKLFLSKPEGRQLERVIFCNFLEKDVKAYTESFPLIFPPTEDDIAKKASEVSAPEASDDDAPQGEELPEQGQENEAEQATQEIRSDEITSVEESVGNNGVMLMPEKVKDSVNNHNNYDLKQALAHIQNISEPPHLNEHSSTNELGETLDQIKELLHETLAKVDNLKQKQY